MKFSTRADVEAASDTVFAAASDYEHFERQALRRGAQIRRTSPPRTRGAGTSWAASFPYRGRQREVDAAVTHYDPETGYVIEGHTGGLDVIFRVEVMDLSRTRSRLLISLELLPRTLTARLLVQSLKLAKGTLDRRFEKRVALFAEEVEKRHRSATV